MAIVTFLLSSFFVFGYFGDTDARQVPEAAGMTLPMVLLLSCLAKHGGYARLVHARCHADKQHCQTSAEGDCSMLMGSGLQLAYLNWLCLPWCQHPFQTSWDAVNNGMSGELTASRWHHQRQAGQSARCRQVGAAWVATGKAMAFWLES